MKRVVPITVLAVVATSLFAGIAGANHAWGPYHWARTANPFTLKVGDNVTSIWDSHLATSCVNWAVTSGACNNPLNPVRTNLVAGTVSNVKRCSAKTGTIQVCNSTYGNTGWLGIASISITGGEHITAGTVKVNDTYFNTPTYNTPAWRQMVMAQEVGHCFGLAHQDENFNNADLLDACGRGSCMDYSNDPTNQGTPNQHDYDQLVTIYSHLDATTTIGSDLPVARGRSGFDADDEDQGVDPENPSTWGRAVGFLNGRANIFEKDLGNGRSVITHVFWIE